MYNHPEISTHGFELDYVCWRDFNKEKRIREMINCELDYFFYLNNKMLMNEYMKQHNYLSEILNILADNGYCDNDFISDQEYIQIENIKKNKRKIKKIKISIILSLLIIIMVICLL